jgi:NTE family protein
MERSTRAGARPCGAAAACCLRILVLLLGVGALSACQSFAYTNRAQAGLRARGLAQSDACTQVSADPAAPYAGRATFAVKLDRGDQNTLVVLSLSGGGSRAAYWSADVMLRLQQVYADQGVDLLAHVNAISSVSGGSLPAAYYAISTDPGDTTGYGRQWDESTVRRLMRKDYTLRWFGNWFWPSNIGKFWFTAFDRTDIMAQTLADNLYDRRVGGLDLTMSDLRPDRPYLILNSTNGTQDHFDQPFTFTAEDFASLHSDLDGYSLARAVMATASFPAVFNYMTLRDYPSCGGQKKYTHVFDGGNSDNLGLTSVARIMADLATSGTRVDNLVVILVDAYTNSNGVSDTRADPRSITDFIVDKNFLAATDALLASNRAAKLQSFQQYFNGWIAADPARKQHAVFYQVQFDDIKQDVALNLKLNQIPTNFKLSADDADAIDQAAALLLTPDNPCLLAIRNLMTKQPHTLPDPVCSFPK